MEIIRKAKRHDETEKKGKKEEKRWDGYQRGNQQKDIETRIPGVEPGAVERAVTPEK